MPRAKPRKRPCRICRRWYLPDVRHKKRQKTCGAPDCQNEWHRRLCADYNKRNRENFKADYLSKKLEKTRDTSLKKSPLQKYPKTLPRSRINLKLPRNFIRERIGAEMLVILEYIIEQVIKRHRAFIVPP